MEPLIIAFGIMIAIMLPVAIWMNTKSGKKWLADL